MFKSLTAIGLAAAAVVAASAPAKAEQYGDSSSCDSGYKVSDPHQKIDFYSRCLRSAPLDGESASTIFINRGVAYLQIREMDKALQDFTSAIKFDPEQPVAYINRALIELSRGQDDLAVGDLERAVQLQPSYSGLANTLAWMLATSPDPSVRNGEKAVAMAQRALKLRDDWKVRDTLAAAYAEAGKFEDAQREEQKAIDTGKASPQDAAGRRARLELYRKGVAFHSGPVAPSTSPK